MHGAEHHVLQRGHLWEQIELLEHHAGFAADLAYLRRIALDAQAIHQQVTAVDGFQHIDASQEGGLAGTRRTHHHYDLTRVDVQRNAVQHHGFAEVLGDVMEFDHAHNMRILFSTRCRLSAIRPVRIR
ncbi:hypothetical protein D3C73_1287670 [compost metagenome]